MYLEATKLASMASASPLVQISRSTTLIWTVLPILITTSWVQTTILSSLHHFESLVSDELLIQYTLCCAKSLQSCLTCCNPVDCSPPGSSVHGISQARALKWVAIPISSGSSWPRGQAYVSCVSWIGREVLYHWATWEATIYSNIILINSNP